jgi:hypothetical protein
MELWAGIISDDFDNDKNFTQIILKGKVDVKIPFTMRLRNNGKTIDGTAHYDNQSPDAVMSIKGTIDDNDEMTLNIFEGKNKIGTYKGILRSDVYMGIFTNTNGKQFPFSSRIEGDNLPLNGLIDNQFETSALIFKKNQNDIHVELRVDYPSNGNKDLVGETRLFIRAAIESLFDIDIIYSDLSDGQVLVNHAGTKKYSNLEKEKRGKKGNFGEYDEILEVNRSFENNKCVSFCASLSCCHGGVVNNFRFGATFKKEDGTQVLVLKHPINPNFESILKETVKSELADKYDMVRKEDFEQNPMPKSSPYLTKNGVQFDYQHCEIGAGALGQVSVVIPYKDIKQYMTNEARMLIEK